jgi:hypothetical protein
MVTIKLLGGLGNQMFQRAFGISLETRGYKVQYDRSALVEGTHREYSLGKFGELPFGTPQEPTVTEHSMLFNQNYLRPPATCTMVGYWQSEKYFELVERNVRDAFKLPGVPVRRVRNIALHVRRQDYVNLQHFHGMPALDYYRNAVAHIRRQAGFFCDVVVISDDRQWCRENLPDFAVFEGKDKYEDLAMMASCDYQVISNSSFSWWGAWLGPQKLVVAPKRWFADNNAESGAGDIVPANWVRL